MNENNDKKILLSLKDVDVKFNVRGRTLQAIRNVSLDIYEHESLAIVGESGSGKSVLTKTFAGMLDSNGYVSHGTIILSDDELSKTDVKLEGFNEKLKAIMSNQEITDYGQLEWSLDEIKEAAIGFGMTYADDGQIVKYTDDGGDDWIF